MRFLLLLATFSIWQLLDFEVLAWKTSYDGKLNIIPIRNDCSTENPIATYSFKDGETVGILFATSCRDGGHLPNYLRIKTIDLAITFIYFNTTAIAL